MLVLKGTLFIKEFDSIRGIDVIWVAIVVMELRLTFIRTLTIDFIYK